MPKEITVTVCDTLPEKADLNDVLSQYYTLIVKRMTDMGFAIDPSAPESALAEFWANVDDYMPPKGCLVIARDAQGITVGCGMLKTLDDETGELKRVFVTEAARGTGTGRKIIELREAVARQMGLKRLVADTLTPNVEMRNLYPKLGFREVLEPIETTTYRDQHMLRDHLHYFVKDLT
ncbi:GNAT family N-acetyltransferase [Yoonia litorea]|uniref:Acetyltransferase (GNAT) family protein n=1 Tax=Yoonia litorea TaxID=1123755 RepID=A0A1I6LXN6_9RHOB|nr:GNAT family N-acetyltransferase [Yoonia litorea]SFS08216.1 Acetyltransferase (GNAT) family protein [Yoonia litorea]